MNDGIADRSYIDHNSKILMDGFKEDINQGMKDLLPMIKEEFELKGIIGLITNPFIDLAAISYFKGMKRTAFKQMAISFECARESLETGNFDGTVEKHFPRFLKLDELYINAKKRHPKFKDIIESLKQEFTLRIKDLIRLISEKPNNEPGQFNTIGEIYKSVYKNDVDAAKTIQLNELSYIEDRINMVKNYEDLLFIPFGLRDKVLKVTEKGLQYTKDNYIANLNRYFE
ncbi:MAG: hypothetical protein ACFFCS_23600 [Candidatus Hodarchaeota archaeon]